MPEEDKDSKLSFPLPPTPGEAPSEEAPAVHPSLNNGLDKPADMKWAEYLVDPTKPLNARQKQVAFMVAKGEKTKVIAEKLNYSVQRVSMLRSSSKIKREIERIQDRMFEGTIDDRIKYLGTDAMDVIESHLQNDNLPTTKREATAKWLVEKLTGKPAQSIDVKGDISVGVFLDKLDEMIESGQTIDVTPKEAKLEQTEEAEPQEETDALAEWVDKNL